MGELLANHRRKGKKFTPPFLQLPNVQIIEVWTNLLPEILHVGLTTELLGLRESTDIWIGMAQLAGSLYPSEKHERFCLASDFSKLNSDQWTTLRAQIPRDYIISLQSSLRPIASWFSTHPLVNAMQGDVSIYSESPGEQDLQVIKRVLKSMSDRRGKAATLAQAIIYYILLSEGNVILTDNVQRPNLDALLMYPDTDESRMEASGMRAMLTSLMGIGDRAAEYSDEFWTQGYLLETCDSQKHTRKGVI